MRDKYAWMARDPRRIGPPPMRISGLVIRLYLICGTVVLVGILAVLVLLMAIGAAR